MVRNSLISIPILLLCLGAVQPKQLEDAQEFDVLIFTQSWPGTVCKIWTHHKPSHSCSFPNRRDSWSIHGVWPTKFGEIGPLFCNKTWLFDPEQVKPIEDDLEQSWVNVEKGTGLYDLWAHEWNKHGTCAAVLDAFNSELKYFSKGISWLKTYSMTEILKASGIVPSDTATYKVDDIYSTIKKSLGKDPVVECKFEDGKQYLMELRICFNKSLDLVDCDGVVYKKYGETILTNCNKSQGIVYPHFENSPKRQYVQLYKFVNWLQWYTL